MSGDFDPTVGVFDLTPVGFYDIFVAKLSQQLLGINENLNENNISIFLNPSNGIFNLSISEPIKNTSIEVYNSIGALVYKKNILSRENTIGLS